MPYGAMHNKMLRRTKTCVTPAHMKNSVSGAVFGESTPLGLLGLAVGCAALLPIAFGRVPHDAASAAMMFQTCAWLCLLFGAGCQMLAGIMCFTNKNTLGGTL